MELVTSRPVDATVTATGTMSPRSERGARRGEGHEQTDGGYLSGTGVVTTRRRVDTTVEVDKAVERAPNRMLVPPAPARLVPIDQRPTRERDDLDELVDDLLGEPADVAPGRFDIALVAAGAAVLVWWLIAAQSAAILLLGIGLIVLGLVLPLRNLRRRFSQRAAARKQATLTARQQLLDASDPAVRDFTDAYGELVPASELPGVTYGAEALAAGYLAVTEVTSLLGGQSPVSQAQIDYIAKRTEAIRGLAQELRHAHEQSLDSERRRLDE